MALRAGRKIHLMVEQPAQSWGLKLPCWEEIGKLGPFPWLLAEIRLCWDEMDGIGWNWNELDFTLRTFQVSDFALSTIGD